MVGGPKFCTMIFVVLMIDFFCAAADQSVTVLGFFLDQMEDSFLTKKLGLGFSTTCTQKLSYKALIHN